MKKISVIPFNKQQRNNKLFYVDKKARESGLCGEPWNYLKNKLEENGCEVGTNDIIPIHKADVVIFLSLNLLSLVKAWWLNKLNRSIYMMFEPPVICRHHEHRYIKKIAGLFARVLTWDDDLVDNNKFDKFYLPMYLPPKVIAYTPFQIKKLVTTIVGNKHSYEDNELYSGRVKIIEFFENTVPEKFKFYGVGWNKKTHPCYDGEVPVKFDILKQYRFSICFENQSNINGYVSEKIFDCMYAHTIPIYLGADNIQFYIPSRCFIDFRKFLNYDELLLYLESMSERDFQDRILDINKYLATDNFMCFLPHNFFNSIWIAINRIEEGNCNVTFLRLPYLFILSALFKFRSYIFKIYNKSATLFMDIYGLC